MNKYDNLMSMNSTWLKDRPTMAENNTIPRLLHLLSVEVQEATDATDEELPAELADVGIFLISLFQALGLDMYDEIADKQAFNLLRYDHKLFKEDSGLTYNEARKRVKKTEGKVKQEFYASGRLHT